MNNKDKLKDLLAKKLKPGVRLNLSFSALEADTGIAKPALEEILHDLEMYDRYIIGFYRPDDTLKGTADDFSIQLREINI